jgi:hypothetical protein
VSSGDQAAGRCNLDVGDQARWGAHGGCENRRQGNAVFASSKNFNAQFGYIARELAYLPDDTVIDGEVVAVDEEGRPNFNLLQNFRSDESRIVYYAFDSPIHDGNDLMRRPLSERREVLRPVVQAEGHVGISEASERPWRKCSSSPRRTALKASWPSVRTVSTNPA